MLPGLSTAELMVIAAIALIVVGPKDLPLVLRKFGQFVGRMRSMAADFRASFDDMARQSELEELRREVEAMRSATTEQMSTANRELSHGLNLEAPSVDPYDPYATPGAPLDAPPAEPETVSADASAEPAAAAKPKRVRKRAAAEPIAEAIEKPVRRTRRKAPGDIVT